MAHWPVRRAGALAAAAALMAVGVLAAVVATGRGMDGSAVLLSAAPLLNGAPHLIGTGLTYVSGPISAGPAGAHMDFGEPDPAAYLKDVSQRGRDPSIAFRSPASEHSEPYHGGVNRWREQRQKAQGFAFPTYYGTSQQDARAVAVGMEQGQESNWGRGFGPNHNGVGQEGAPRALGVAEKKYWDKAAAAYDDALGHLYDAQDSSDTAAWVAEGGFYPGLAPRAPEYTASAYNNVARAASKFPAGLTKPEWYPGGDYYPDMSSYYTNYWDRNFLVALKVG